MEKAKTLIQTHQDKFKFLVLGGAGIAAFNCFVRADYNLIIYIYTYYVWNMLDSKETQSNEKINVFFLLFFSLIIDFIWVFYWGGRWSLIKIDNQSFIHSLVILLSFIAILNKVKFW